MIDHSLTRRHRLTILANDRTGGQQYRSDSKVVAACDKCGSFITKHGSIVLHNLLKGRKKYGGKDLCAACKKRRREELHPPLNFAKAKKAFLELVKTNGGKRLSSDELPGFLYRYVYEKYTGGYHAFSGACGYPNPRKKRGHWLDISNVDEALLPICRTLGRLPRATEVCQSLNLAIAKHGGRQRFAKRLGYPSERWIEADDGHFVESYYELLIDNMLHRLGVQHEVHPVLFRGKKYRADFLAGNTHIEVAGFERDGYDGYQRNLKRKLQLYKKHNIKVIVIRSRDFDSTDNAGEYPKVKAKLIRLIGKAAPDGCRGIRNSVRPAIWWRKWKNVRLLWKEAIKSVGHFPTDKELRNIGMPSLIYYSCKFHEESLRYEDA